MAFEKCLTSFNEATGLNLSDDESRSILQEMLKAKERLGAQGEFYDPLKMAADSLADKKMQDAVRTKLTTLRNAAKREIVMSQVRTNGGLKNAIDTIRSILHGSNKFARNSVESTWHGLRDGWLAATNNELYKSGMKKAAESGEMDKEIAAAWWKISNKESPGNSPGAKVAQIYSKALDSMRDRLNAAGAFIGDAKDYVTTTTYDPVKMRRAAGNAKSADEAFSAWWSKTEPRLSEKNFYNVAPLPGDTMQEARRAFGRSVFDSIMTGVHMTAGGDAEGGFIHPDYSGTLNVAQKVSHYRTLIWKDSDSWLGHMQDYGQYPNINASVMMSLDRGARAFALMDKLGTNPAANLNMVIRRIQEAYRSDVDGVAKFQGKIQGVQNVMGRLDGTLNIPANMGLAKGASAIRTWESVSSLGGVGITHLTSIFPTVTSELAHHGIGRIEALGNIIKALKTGVGTAEHQAIMSDIGAYADGAIRHVQSVLGDDSLPGRISSMAGRFMDMTGIHLVFDRTKAGVRDMLSHNLARNLSKPWEDLDPHLSQMLGKYGVTPDAWSGMKDADLADYNGRKYLTPSAAEAAVPGMSDKLLSYFSDGAAHGVVSPGVRERALLLGATRPGTGAGEMLRFLTQFKMWPVAAMHQILEREIFMSLSGKEAAWNIGKLMAIGIPAGYMRMLVNDTITGHPPRNPLDPKTLLAAAAQSGGLGIMGDFLFGETSRMGGGLVSTLGGPVVSDADALVKIFNEWKEGKAGWPDLAHFGVRHIPFANLVYLKGALDYMLWYHLYEAASPGWWERTNRRLQKEQGRTMTGYSPGGGVPMGVPGIYLHNKNGQPSGVLSR